MKKAPKVDRVEFGKILGRMIATPPEKRTVTPTRGFAQTISSRGDEGMAG
jgi:hypothetical protein